jgi:hypothetical protein
MKIEKNCAYVGWIWNYSLCVCVCLGYINAHFKFLTLGMKWRQIATYMRNVLFVGR